MNSTFLVDPRTLCMYLHRYVHSVLVSTRKVVSMSDLNSKLIIQYPDSDPPKNIDLGFKLGTLIVDTGTVSLHVCIFSNTFYPKRNM